MRHLDLFSGVAGFALAARWVWGKAHRILAFVEIDPFCQKVLAKNFPGVPIYGDIRAFKATEFMGKVDLLTGGWPCQPFSRAGKRRGKADDRYLWPEMFRVIKECRPRWVVGENVTGIINLALDDVLADLESAGYEAWTVVIPACAVNAPHRRDRVWIVAFNVADSPGRRYGERSESGGPEKRNLKGSVGDGSDSENPVMAHSDGTGLEGFLGVQGFSQLPTWSGGSLSMPWPVTEWIENREVERVFCGMADGVSSRMDGCELKPVRNRKKRLQALGNVIVPQVAVVLFSALRKVEEYIRFAGSNSFAIV